MFKQVLHIEKPKVVAVINSIGEENDRQTSEQIAKQMEKNANIDPTRTHLNCDLVDGIDHTLKLNERVNKRIKEGYTSDRKIRTDAVRVCDGVFGAGAEFFAGMSDEEIKKFGMDFAEFLVQKVGKENIVGCRLHMDEKAGKDEKGRQLYAVHIHFQFVPLKDGKLVRREFGISQNGLKYWHTECAKWMQKKGWQLERGEERQPWQEPVKHEQPNEYKRTHFSDKVPSVKLEKILHEIDGRVDVSSSFFSKKETAEMDADDYRKLRDIAGQVVTLRRRVEELERKTKDIEKNRSRYYDKMDELDDDIDFMRQMNAELADQNAQLEAKRLISELTLKNEEADRRLQQVKEKQETAEKLADSLVDRALNDPPKREALITTFRENAFNYLKKADPKLYEEILNIGRRESMATEKKELELGKDKSKGRTL